jgi:hypothetical protein
MFTDFPQNHWLIINLEDRLFVPGTEKNYDIG